MVGYSSTTSVPLLVAMVTCGKGAVPLTPPKQFTGGVVAVGLSLPPQEASSAEVARAKTVKRFKANFLKNQIERKRGILGASPASLRL